MALSAGRRLPRLSQGPLSRNGARKGVSAVSPLHAPCGLGSAGQAEGPSPLSTRLTDDAGVPAAAGAWGPGCAPCHPDLESPAGARLYQPPPSAAPPAASDAASQQAPFAHFSSALGPPRIPFVTWTAPAGEPGRSGAAKCRSGERAGPWSSSSTETPSARSLLAGPGTRPWGSSAAKCRNSEDLPSGHLRVKPMSPLAGPGVHPWWRYTIDPAGQPSTWLQCSSAARRAELSREGPLAHVPSHSAGRAELARGRTPLAHPLVHHWCITPPLRHLLPHATITAELSVCSSSMDMVHGGPSPLVHHRCITLPSTPAPHAAAPPPVHRCCTREGALPPQALWVTPPLAIQTPPAAPRSLVHHRCTSPTPMQTPHAAAPVPVHHWCTSPIQTPRAAARSPPPGSGGSLSLVRHRCTPRLSFVSVPSIPPRACALAPFCPLALPLTSLANSPRQFAKAQPLAALVGHWRTQGPLVDHWRTQRPLVGQWHTQRRSMFIQTLSTPNPASLKFLPGVPVLDAGATADFTSARAALTSPLALTLFRIDGVARVFLGSDFITVSKTEEASWDLVKPEVFAAIMDFFASGKPVLDASATTNQETGEEDSEIVEAIKELLETRIRPAVQEDGGDIDFHSFNEETGVVVLRMRGACSGCPSSSVTLKSGVENMLMHYIPEVTSVEQLMEGEEAPE